MLLVVVGVVAVVAVVAGWRQQVLLDVEIPGYQVQIAISLPRSLFDCGRLDQMAQSGWARRHVAYMLW